MKILVGPLAPATLTRARRKARAGKPRPPNILVYASVSYWRDKSIQAFFFHSGKAKGRVVEKARLAADRRILYAGRFRTCRKLPQPSFAGNGCLDVIARACVCTYLNPRRLNSDWTPTYAYIDFHLNTPARLRNCAAATTPNEE